MNLLVTYTTLALMFGLIGSASAQAKTFVYELDDVTDLDIRRALNWNCAVAMKTSFALMPRTRRISVFATTIGAYHWSRWRFAVFLAWRKRVGDRVGDAEVVARIL